MDLSETSLQFSHPTDDDTNNIYMIIIEDIETDFSNIETQLTYNELLTEFKNHILISLKPYFL